MELLILGAVEQEKDMELIAGVGERGEVLFNASPEEAKGYKVGEVYDVKKIDEEKMVDYEDLSWVSQVAVVSRVEGDNEDSLTDQMINWGALHGYSVERIFNDLKKDNQESLEYGGNPVFSFSENAEIGVNFESIRFPEGHFMSDEMNLFTQEDYVKAGVLEKCSEESISSDIYNGLTDAFGYRSVDDLTKEVLQDVADSVAADISVHRGVDDVDELVRSTVSDMSQGCGSGAIPKMIYSDAVLEFYDRHENDVLNKMTELMNEGSITKLPDRSDPFIRGDENKEFAARVAYEDVIFRLDAALGSRGNDFENVEVYRKKQIEGQAVSRPTVNEIEVEVSKDKSREANKPERK